MVSRTGSRTSTDRRSFLAATGATLAGGALATRAATRTASAASTSFHLAQGDQCIPLQALTGDDPVTAFYDYRTDRYSSYGTRSLQRANTSVLFLYEDTDGVSLVFVHGKLGGDGDGGSVTFEISGLPSSGDWLIRDDSYDGPNRYDRWDLDGSSATVDWTWDSRRADGGVYGPLGDDVSIEIDPAFDERAALYGDHYTGTVSDWQALSGDRSDPTRTSLDESTPVRIESGACPTTATTSARSSTPGTTERTTTAESTATSTRSTTATASRPTTTGSGSGGTRDDLRSLFDELSGFLHWLSRVFARAGRSVDRVSHAIGRLL